MKHYPKSLLIKNTRICDGSGKPGYSGAVIIENGRISAAAPKLPETGHDGIVDAGGLTLAPGFIDAHGHSDLSCLVVPEAFGNITQGITTEIAGNCGLSAFPITDLNREHLQEVYRNYNIKITWKNLRDLVSELTRRQPAVNLAFFCGHNTLRGAVAGYGKSELSNCQVQEMRRLLSDALDAGAIGISTGLLYIPGKFATEMELAETFQPVGKAGKIYSTHLRSEGNKLVEAIEEAIRVAKKAGIGHLHISHLKTAGKNNWQKLDEVIALIGKEQNSGLQITADRYPYVESMTQISIITPPPYDDLDSSALQELLADPAEYAKFLENLNTISPERWRSVRLVSTDGPGMESYLGQNLEEIAEKRQTSPREVLAGLLKTDSSGTMAAFKGMSETNLKRILQIPYVCGCTDDAARPEDYSLGRSHPRGFGSMPRIINLLKPVIGLEAAIAKITSLPARIFGLRNRGLIAPGYAADLVLFDPDKLRDNATFANPHLPASGIEKVWVNGKLACKNSRGGEFLSCGEKQSFK